MEKYMHTHLTFRVDFLTLYSVISVKHSTRLREPDNSSSLDATPG